MTDLIDKIMLTSRAAQAWIAHVNSPDVQQVIKGLTPADIPDEQAIKNKDGSLTLYVKLPKKRGEVRLRIEPDDWFYVQ